MCSVKSVRCHTDFAAFFAADRSVRREHPLSRGTLTKVIGACCGLAAFAIAVIAGLASENPGEVILFRALVGMFVCQFVGLGIGMVIERIVMDSIQAHKQSRPDPSVAGVSVGTSPTGAAAS